MRLLRHLIFAGLVWLLCISAQARQGFPTLVPWAVNRHCAADPIAPPEGWSFPGVIVSTVPEDGIRGLRADTFKTYYIAFAGSNFTEGGALSPDGKWYAVPFGYIQTAASSDLRYIVQELRVMSTEALPKVRAQMVWKASYQVGAIQPIRWLDNASF
ncbi:MAG TPA: hypothetical protein VHL11_12580, partial [Phototrophicaceae bacterium]|nr:hypothetical protein [Phototrophicaceae bacterium]